MGDESSGPEGSGGPGGALPIEESTGQTRSAIDDYVFELGHLLVNAPVPKTQVPCDDG